MSLLVDNRPPTRSRPARFTTAALIAVIHILPLVAILMGPAREDWILFACIYPVQLFGIGVCMHRYFAHNAFRTSRAFQLVLALMAASAFGNPVKFAGKHRLHHLHTDDHGDPHSPLMGFWSSWFGSHVDCRYTEGEILEQVPTLTRYPELMWLHRYWMVPGLVLCLGVFLMSGFSGLAIGVLLGAAIVLNLSSGVNYFCHKSGLRRFDTPDNSTNNWWLAVLAAGEGWHNNHHRYPVSARAGFCWWEIDLFYWVICLFEKLGLVWEVRRPPASVLREGGLEPLGVGAREGP